MHEARSAPAEPHGRGHLLELALKADEEGGAREAEDVADGVLPRELRRIAQQQRRRWILQRQHYHDPHRHIQVLSV